MEELMLPHKLTLEGRSKLTMTGVTEVVSFDENAVFLHTTLGDLLVQGEELKLKTLSVEGGQVSVEGKILPWPTRSPGAPAAGSAVCWDDLPGGGRPPALGQPAAGVWAWHLLRISAPPAAHRPPGHPVSCRAVPGVAVAELRPVPGGSAAGISGRAFGGHLALGLVPRAASSRPLCPVLAGYGSSLGIFPASFKKIL